LRPNKKAKTMAGFNYNTEAELFPAAIRKKKRAGFTYRRFGRFGTAAEAVLFAIEQLRTARLRRRCRTGDR